MLEYCDLIQRIQIKQNEFSKGQKRLGTYITENYDKAAYMTASKLGKEANTSESTVIRFAYLLEYDGYPALQSAMKVIVRTKSSSIQRLEVASDRLKQHNLLESILHADENKIKDTIAEINQDEFDKVVDVILNAKRIYILGVRSSGFLAGLLGYYFNMIFDHVKLVDANGPSDTFEQIYRICKEDVFIGITFPRYSKRTVQALEYAKQRGAKTIAITDSELSPITPFGTYNLIAKSDVIAIVDSLVAPQSLINALVVGVCMKRKEEVSDRLMSLEELWKTYDVYDNLDIVDRSKSEEDCE